MLGYIICIFKYDPKTRNIRGRLLKIAYSLNILSLYTF